MLGFLFIIFLSLVVVVVQKIANAPNAEQLQTREKIEKLVERDRQIASFAYRVGEYTVYIIPTESLISFSNQDYYIRVNFDNVLKVIPIEFANNESKGGSALGGAAVGGLLAGGVGAIVGATAGAKSRNYTRVRQLGFVFELYDSVNDNIERIDLIILEDSTNSAVIRKAYQLFDRMLLDFKTYFPDKFAI